MEAPPKSNGERDILEFEDGLAKVLEELDGAGVTFQSASEPFDTTTAGRMMVHMLGVFAESARQTTSIRTPAHRDRAHRSAPRVGTVRLIGGDAAINQCQRPAEFLNLRVGVSWSRRV
jgi:Resolvase, N terminal domain